MKLAKLTEAEIDLIDPYAALSELGYEAVLEVQRIGGGWDTLLWRFRTSDGLDHTLRVYYLPRRQEISKRERNALEACARTGLPAPRIEKVSQFQGYPVLILTWCHGVSLLSIVEKKPWLLWHMARVFGRMQAQIHSVKLPADLDSLRVDDWVSRVPEGYENLVEHARSLNLSNNTLIHMDFHPLNVICDGTVMTGVVDWAGATMGDRLADLARTASCLLAAPLPPGPLRVFFQFSRQVFLKGWRAGYEEVAGPIPNYRPLMAWAGATLLAEIEQVIGQPYVWGTEQDLQKLKSFIRVWQEEAGIR